MANIAIVGYGKMGKEIETLAKEKGHTVKVIIDPNQKNAEKEINERTMKGVDVCVDFTHPSVIIENIKKYSKLGVNAVIGTTGWYNKMDEVEKIVKKGNIGLIWSGNFSIGVNAFFRIIGYASKIFNNIEYYDVMSTERHHKFKADSPSGTANMIGKIILENMDRKKKMVFDKLDRKIEPDELHIASIRGGYCPGMHDVLFDSDFDTIEIRHTNRSRAGLASGSVMAIDFINGKKGFYNINDMMDEIIGGN